MATVPLARVATHEGDGTWRVKSCVSDWIGMVPAVADVDVGATVCGSGGELKCSLEATGLEELA